MKTNSDGVDWVGVYKTSCEIDAESKQQLLTEFGVKSFIENWGNTADLPFGASTVSRAYQINVNADELDAVRKIFHKMKIVGYGFEELGNRRWLKSVTFVGLSLLVFGLIAIVPGVGKWLFFMSIPFIVLYGLKYMIDRDREALKKK